METASKGRMATFAIVGLCIVVGVMSMLAVIYYTNATNTQNNNSIEIVTLRAQNAALEHQVESLNAQMLNLNGQLTSLNTQLTNANARNGDMQTQLNGMYDWINDLAFRLAKKEMTNLLGTTGGGGNGAARD